MIRYLSLQNVGFELVYKNITIEFARNRIGIIVRQENSKSEFEQNQLSEELT